MFAVVNLEVASFSYKYLLIMSVDQSGRKDKSYQRGKTVFIRSCLASYFHG